MDKVLIDGRLLSNRNTGISRYTEQVIKSYVDLYGKDKVFVIVNNSAWENVYNIILTRYKPFNILHFFLFGFYIKKLKINCIHFTYYSGLFKKSKGITTIVTVHDLMYRIVPEFFSKNQIINKLAIFYYDTIVKKSLSSADTIIAVSNTTKNDITRFFKFNSIVVPEGINNTNFEVENENEILINYQLKTKNFLFYVGNLRKQKNIEFLIEAFEKSNTDKQLVICGNYVGVDENWLNKENIKFLGYTSDLVLGVLYRNCSAFIFPSLYEGFGLPVLEALSNRAIVFSSNGGALNELNCQGIFHFDPEVSEELQVLISNVDQFVFNDLEVNQFLSNYSWDRCMAMMHSFLNNNKDRNE